MKMCFECFFFEKFYGVLGYIGIDIIFDLLYDARVWQLFQDTNFMAKVADWVGVGKGESFECNTVSCLDVVFY